jgi:predicted permease
VTDGAPQDVGVHFVTPGWFATMRVPLTRGRLLTDADRLGTHKVIVISESAARRYWPGQDPLGTRAGIWQGGFQDGATVVGIVGDVRYGTIDSVPQPDVYISFNQSPRTAMRIFLRTTVDPTAVAAPARAVLKELVPDYPAFDVRTMRERVAGASAQARFSAALLALFAAFALALAVVGLYGVMSYGVLQRTREIGIRIALGADRGRVQRMVIGEGVAMALAGSAIGLLAALSLTRVMRSLLYGVTPSDAMTYVAIVLVLGTAALAASWVPARRATRVDPMRALRQD